MTGQPPSTPVPAQVQADYARKTWRYLRLGMIGLVIALATAVGYEVIHNDGCWQTSISAYYYTHAQAVFVAALVAIGTCLVCLRGSTDAEDILLNVAGMLAPVVAFVPTPGAGACATLPGPKDPTANIENNVTALLVVGAVAFAFLVVLSWGRTQPTIARIGYGVALAVWLGAGVAFLVLPRDKFVDNAHLVAAIAMFSCIILVSWVNALSFRDKQRDPNARNRYSVIAALMLTVFVLLLIGGKHHILLAEIDAIFLFAVFWGFQTEELWDEGLRPT